MSKVVVGWYVVGILDDDDEVEVVEPRRLSRLYHVRDAAEQFADLVRPYCSKHLSTVMVLTRSKREKTEITL